MRAVIQPIEEGYARYLSNRSANQCGVFLISIPKERMILRRSKFVSAFKNSAVVFRQCIERLFLGLPLVIYRGRPK